MYVPVAWLLISYGVGTQKSASEADFKLQSCSYKRRRSFKPAIPKLHITTYWWVASTCKVGCGLNFPGYPCVWMASNRSHSRGTGWPQRPLPGCTGLVTSRVVHQNGVTQKKLSRHHQEHLRPTVKDEWFELYRYSNSVGAQGWQAYFQDVHSKQWSPWNVYAFEVVILMFESKESLTKCNH